MPWPFEASPTEIREDPDRYVDSVFGVLDSSFLTIPKGRGFVEYPVFEQGYESLKKATRGFREVTPDRVIAAVTGTPMALVVLRSILGFSPPEWAEAASGKADAGVDQGFARTLDRKIRLDPAAPVFGAGERTDARIRLLVETACDLLRAGPPLPTDATIHRLQKADTGSGVAGLRTMADLGAPYAVLLYERFLGRPFASHRDSVSELIGEVLEDAVEKVLVAAGVSFRRTARTDRLEGFDQVPDFVVPSEFNPRVVIEAKIAEDDGTARDEVTRVQHLASLSGVRRRSGADPFQVVAVIGGRGFSVRREDLKKLLLATGGKVFTLRQLDSLVRHTDLAAFASIR